MDARVKRIVNEVVGADRWKQGKARAEELRQQTIEHELAATRLQWAWGDLTLELVPMSVKSGDHSLVAVIIDAMVEDYDIPWSRSTLHSLRQTCGAWPKSRRAKCSFAVHKVLKSNPDRYRLIRDDMKVREAQGIQGHALRVTTGSVGPREAARAVISWSSTLARKIPSQPSTDLLAEVRRAWCELTRLALSLGIIDKSLTIQKALDDDRLGDRSGHRRHHLV